MVNVIGVRFENAGKLYFFDPGAFWPTAGDFVVVETARGIELGEVVVPVHEMNDEQLAAPLKKVVRIASAQDIQHDKDNRTAEKEAYAVCQQKIAEHKLDMKLVSVEYTFDNSKILFYFTANGRVDFRSLVKDLAAVFKTRIELRQIGVRDEAKMLGGLGPCGRPICCGTFLGDFQPVSIKMAKEQNLSLNPTKISGVCGRLMCCLKYEEDTYEATRKRMPKVGREIMTPEGPATVLDLNIIKESVRVRIQKGDSSEVRDFTLEELPQYSGRREETPREPMPDHPADRPQETEMPERPARAPRPPRPERPERAERAEGEQRERPARQPREQRQHPQQQAQRPAQPARAAVPADAAAPGAPAPEARPAGTRPAAAPAPARTTAPVKPAASAWKEALERAMRAANGGDSDQVIETAPAAPAAPGVSAPSVSTAADQSPVLPAIHEEDDTI